MTDRTVTHDVFTIERTYPESPQDVFAAWASEEAKLVWFAEADGWLGSTFEYSLDFHVGGREVLEGTSESGRTFRYAAIYQDIVEDHRIVSSYEVYVAGQRISVSLMTVEFDEADGGTRLTLTEQGAFLDGLDTNAERIQGATQMLDIFGGYLAGRRA